MFVLGGFFFSYEESQMFMKIVFALRKNSFEIQPLTSDFLLYWLVYRLRKGERGYYIGVLQTGSPGGSAFIS